MAQPLKGEARNIDTIIRPSFLAGPLPLASAWNLFSPGLFKNLYKNQLKVIKNLIWFVGWLIFKNHLLKTFIGF